MAKPIFIRTLQRPGKGEKVYRLTEEEIAEILRVRSGSGTCASIELDPGMGGANPKTIREWIQGGALITSVDFMLTKRCNFRCEYCFAEAGLSKEKLPFELLERTIEEGPSVGVRVFVLTGGEPFMFRDRGKTFFDVVRRIRDVYAKAGRPVGVSAFSDVALITRERAQVLYEHGVALCLKRDSLDAQVQDKLVGIRGGMAKMEAGYENLFKAGYGRPGSPPISVNSVLSTDTMTGMVDLHRWVRRHGMEHSIVPVHYCGNATTDNQEEGIHAVHVKVLYDIVAEIDAQEFNDPWRAYSAFPKNKTCNRNISGVHVRSNGAVTACSESPLMEDYVFGNLHETTLGAIARSEKLRHYRQEFTRGHGEYICNPDVCDLNANDLCRGGCATRSAYSRIDPVTGLIVANTNPKSYSARREDPLCPGWVMLAKMQGVLRPGLEEQIRETFLGKRLS